MIMSYHLEKTWQKLFDSAFFRSNSVQSVKAKFADMTTEEIKTFRIDVNICILHDFYLFIELFWNLFDLHPCS